MMFKIFQSLLLISALLPGLVLAEARLELTRNPISLDETTNLILHVETATFARMPQIPLPDGLQVTSTARQELIQGGERALSIVYTLTPSKTGSFTIGPFQIKTDQGESKLPALTLQVTEPRPVRDSGDLFVTLEASATELLVRETVELTLTFYSLRGIGNINVADFPNQGFDLTEWQPLQSRPRQIGNREYRVTRFVASLTPTRPGLLEIHPVFRVEIPDTDEPFNMMFGRRNIRSLRLQPAEALRLEVGNPPEAGRPEDYQGHIGRFQLEAAASPREVRAGNPVTLRVELRGDGSIRQALPPRLEESDDFKVYQPRMVQEEYQRDGSGGRKVLEQVIIPQHEGITEVPALRFSYFDPATRAYQTLVAGPFPLEVREGTEGGAQILSMLPEGTHGSATLLGDDLLYLKTQPGKLWRNQDLEIGLLELGFSALPFAGWALTALIGARRARKSADPAARRRMEAPRRLRRHLKELTPGENALESVWRTLSAYLGDRLNLPPGALAWSEVEGRLPPSVSEECRRELADWMARCDSARFAGTVPTESAAAGIWESFQEFMPRLDREIGK